jgi:hypothetical protein
MASSIDPSCHFFGDVEIPRVIKELQHVADLLPSIPPAEKKSQDDRALSYFHEGDIPPSQRSPGMDKDLNRLSKDMSQWRYSYLARLLNSMKSAQAAVGYILLDGGGSESLPGKRRAPGKRYTPLKRPAG